MSRVSTQSAMMTRSYSHSRTASIGPWMPARYFVASRDKGQVYDLLTNTFSKGLSVWNNQTRKCSPLTKCMNEGSQGSEICQVLRESIYILEK